MTQFELADRLGISFQAVSNWERGNSMPDISKLPALSEVFQVSVDELIGKENSAVSPVIRIETARSGEDSHHVIHIEMTKSENVLPEEQNRHSGSATLAALLPYLDEEYIEKLASEWLEAGRSINLFLPFMKAGKVKEWAFAAFENGDLQSLSSYLPFMDADDVRLLAEKQRIRESEHTADRPCAILETDRLILRPWRESDAESLYEYAKDPAVGPIAGWPPHTGAENSREIIRTVLAVPENYAVCLKENNVAIGCIGLKLGDATDMTDRGDECELGYWLGKPFWGRGLVPEAAQALIRHGFEDLQMRAIWCGYYDGNERSKRVQEKCGFVYHHTTEGLEVPLMGEVRTGHVSLLTKERWLLNIS